MKAVRIHDFGGTEVLHVEEVPTPRPGDDEVLIKVHAASVNPVDYKMRTGEFKGDGMTMPLTLGRDVSGTIEAIGANVFEFGRGDPVYAMLDFDQGGYAEYVIAKASNVAHKPASVDHVHAAAVPLAAITAWQGLFDHGGLEAGERVLIHGAAGGVGHLAVQFAKHKGATVVATARADDIELLRRLGADEVVDYENQKFEDRVKDIDLVLDLVAGDTQRRSWKCLRKGGRMVSTLKAPSRFESVIHGAKGEHFMAKPDRGELEEIGRLIDGGEVKVVVQETLPLGQAAVAHDHLEHGHVRGKVVLEVATADT
ncbi:MAG TPA: NADP-dependent oxidoreductase [Opitutaceae bacterium]|jgi:NADPH:quinone reductase-like Zn-dependent oxidoreductase